MTLHPAFPKSSYAELLPAQRVIPIRVKNDNCVGIVFGSWPHSNVLSSSPHPCRLVLLSNAKWNKVR
ncbi:MAG: hypothetical protein ABL865_02055, partial [Candidatus Nitrotoga sp.]